MNAQPNDLIATIKSSKKGFTPVLEKIADFVINNQEKVLHSTITEIASSTESSEASVMRFCRELKFNSFYDFKVTLATYLAQLSNNHEPNFREVGTKNAITSAIDAVIKSLQETEMLLSIEELKIAGERISKANRVICFGVGNSVVIAQQLTMRLMRLGINISYYPDPHYTIMSLSMAKENDDVFITVTSSGNTPEIIGVLEIAKERDLFSIVISSQKKSKATNLADCVLVASVPENPLSGTTFTSRICQMLVVDALCNVILENDSTRAEQTQKTVAALLSYHDKL